MTVPLKVISLLNMATTKFPLSRELDWPSDKAEVKNREARATHFTTNLRNESAHMEEHNLGPKIGLSVRQKTKHF